MVSFVTRMDVGFPGAANRAHDATVEPGVLDPTVPANVPTAYGVALVNDGNGLRLPIASTDVVYGFYVRPYPTTSSQDPLFTDTPPTPAQAGTVSVMKRGYMTVKLAGGPAAVKGGAIFVGSAGPDVVGGVYSATAVGRIALDAKSYFMGAADAKGITEIAINI